jgi:hypothetical protein
MGARAAQHTKRIFRVTFLLTYTLVAAVCFCLIFLIIVKYGHETTTKIILKAVATTAGFIGVIHPLVRRALLGRGTLTSFGRSVSHRFDISPDEVADAISFPWQATLSLSVVLFIVDFVRGILEK